MTPRIAGALLLLTACGNSAAPAHWWGPTMQITNRALVIDGRVINGTCSTNCTVRPTRYVTVATDPGGAYGNVIATVDYGTTTCAGIDTNLTRVPQSARATAEGGGLLYYARDTTLVVYNGGTLPGPLAVDFNSSPGWEWIINDSLLPDSTILHRGTFGPTAACRL